MNSKIWLIGGTSDSKKIAELLESNNISFIVSVVTLTAKNLYSPKTQVVTGCMNLNKMQSFCHEENIVGIVDASHPYAQEVSQQVIKIAAQFKLPYLRYERDNYRTVKGEHNDSLITRLDSFSTLLSSNYLTGHNVLLTIGCKTLWQFESWQKRATLYARILPKIESIKIAESAGFTSDRLIAIRPPLSHNLEKALWQHWQISLVITKASGKAGGEDLKHQVAKELNIPLIIIDRPNLIYPQQTSNLRKILDFCQENIPEYS